ncbi:MAG TPA: TIGR01777 family oxidoreductase [Candidatus Eremiobacteraceae bacterium]|nr:TIGR01777 family oxidoreductase [Candidatus Eremiobacteraceae bacterium]
MPVRRGYLGKMKKVAVTGASGFVGRAIVAALAKRGDAVLALGRSASIDDLPQGVRTARFDPNDTKPHPELFEGLDAVVHLAGETVDGRWNEEKKRRIFDSRVVGTRNLVSTLAKCDIARPPVLICASAVGFYGSRGDEVLSESSPPGDDFLAGVCKAWENEADVALLLGMRVAKVRVSFVLGDGGAVRKLLPPFKAFVGGPFGTGRMWFPWIHLEDIAAMFLWAIDHPEVSGALNAVSPDVATNARFVQALGHAISRPALAPVPPFGLKLVVGEFADAVLASQLVLPAKAMDLGFRWEHESLEEAMLDVLAPNTNKKPATHELRAEQYIPRPIEDVWRFFADASKLPQVTPPKLRIVIVDPPTELTRGATIDYSVRVGGLRMKWRTLIAGLTAGSSFVDYQVRGPYALWRHRHGFEVGKSGGTIVRDEVRYSLPWAPLSDIALPSVRHELSDIWAYRRHKISELFS